MILRKLARFALVFAVSIGWIFSGWPQIFGFPSTVQRVNASTVTLAPTGVVGACDSWTLGAGASKESAVGTNDADTSYINGGANNNKQGFIFADAGIPAGATVNSVTVNVVHKRDANKNSGGDFIHDGTGCNNTSVQSYTSTSAYATESLVLSLDPATSAAWTAATVNGWSDGSRFFGVRRTVGNAELRVTQISIVVDYTYTPPTFEQAAYRFFANANGTDVGSALAAQDTAATLSSAGDAFRLRTLLHIGTSQLAISGQNFKLQFAAKSGTCDAAFSGETYADVTGATAIAYSTANTPADGDNLTANANDPTHSGHTIVNQDYEEANNFTNTVAAIPAGQDGKWDFSLIDNGAPSSTSYCFRAVKSDGSPLDTYTVIPEVVTATPPSTFEQAAYRFFANANGTDVGTALAAQNTAATLSAAGDAFRLRSLLHIGTSQLAISGQNFKLQFAAKSGTCDAAFSGETYADVTGATAIAYSTANTPADGDNLTANANDPTHSGHTIVSQDYEEANNFTNTVAAIPAGQDGKWDFSLIDNGAPSSTSYCFRAVKSDGSPLDTYTVIPEVITAAPSNTLPVASGVSIDSGAASITLTEGTTKSVSCVGTVTDNDGFADITSVTADFFRASRLISSGLDDNDHYRLAGDASCVPSGGAGNSETYTCVFAVQYFADATDAGSPYPTDIWICNMAPSDAVGAGTSASDAIEMASLFALDVTSSINYGTVSPDTDTGATNQTTTVTNTGNRDMDPQLSDSIGLYGSNGWIPGYYQKYSSSPFTYSVGGTALSSTPTTIDLALPQRTVGAVTANVYWGIRVPNATPAGAYAGTNTFSATAGI